MTLSLKWIWELTPKQVFQKNRFVRTSNTIKLFQETRAFLGTKQSLPDTSYTYQLALSRSGKTEEPILLSQAHPDIPDSGDYRSGIIIFDGEEIIASLIISGVNAKQPFKMVVHPDYRQQGLAERLLVEWWSRVKHTYREVSDQAMTVVAVKVLLNAYQVVVARALDQPAPMVPENVRAALADGIEAAQVLAAAQAVEDAE